MLKKMVKGLILGGAMLALAVPVSADYDLNIYGASAQFKYWKAAAPLFLQDQGCDASDLVTIEGEDFSRDSGAARCNDLDGEVVTIRYTTNASYDGVLGVQDIDTFMPAEDANTCTTAGERIMINLDGTWSCQDVHVGASDVAASTFNQASNGCTKGHLSWDGAGGLPTSCQTNDGILEHISRTISGISATGLDVENPVVVPFSFFANGSVNIDNMSRTLALQLYSGQIANWEEVDPAMSDDVVLCLRHAGSGTHATIDAAVMRGDEGLPTTQLTPTNGFVTSGQRRITWFNKGSSDMVRCVGQNPGAIGYADTDKCAETLAENEGDSKCDDVKRLKYNGYWGNRSNIKNGLYDFWAQQFFYFDRGSLATSQESLVDALVAFASDPLNLEGTGKEDFWASQGEMLVEKIDDFKMPTRKVQE